jgi:hypothetical protein
MCRPTGYETGSTQKYICCFIRVTDAIKLCVLETEEFFELIRVLVGILFVVMLEQRPQRLRSHFLLKKH